MRIAIDGGTWRNQRGYGRFTRELVTALGRRRTHTYELVLESAATGPCPSEPIEGVHVVPVRLSTPPSDAASADGWRSPLDMWRMGRALARLAPDVVFFPSVYTFVPVPSRVPKVVTIHDVIAERWPSLVFASVRARAFWTAKVRMARWQADRILTVSEHAARGIRDVFHTDPRRVRVCGEAPAHTFGPSMRPGQGHEVLSRCGVPLDAEVTAYLGGVSPHKNLPALVRAFAWVARDRPARPLYLLLIGDYEHDVFLSAYPEVRRVVERECPDRVRFTGRLADDELAALLGLVRVVALPSFDEGFGLPAVEAAACGAAVIATRQSAIPEVLGDAALYIDPHDEGTLRAALAKVLDEEPFRQALASRGQARARALSWDASAARVEAVFEELAREREPRS